MGFSIANNSSNGSLAHKLSWNYKNQSEALQEASEGLLYLPHQVSQGSLLSNCFIQSNFPLQFMSLQSPFHKIKKELVYGY